MLKRIVDLPENVLGIEASGKVTADDYQSVLIPALDDRLGKIKKVRFLYMLGETFYRFSGAAAWEDTKIGLKHLSHFDRIAIVTNVNWIQNSIKFFGFALPGEVRVFKNGDLQTAKDWISEPAPAGNLTFDFLEEQGVLVLHPHGELEIADFERIASEVDPYIEKQGKLKGVMIVAEHFPGWDDLSTLATHFRFVKEHRQNVGRLAIVSNDRMMSTLPFLAKHFLVDESRHFSMDRKNEALAWFSQGQAMCCSGQHGIKSFDNIGILLDHNRH